MAWLQKELSKALWLLRSDIMSRAAWMHQNTASDKTLLANRLNIGTSVSFCFGVPGWLSGTCGNSISETWSGFHSIAISLGMSWMNRDQLQTLGDYACLLPGGKASFHWNKRFIWTDRHHSIMSTRQSFLSPQLASIENGHIAAGWDTFAVFPLSQALEFCSFVQELQRKEWATSSPLVISV